MILQYILRTLVPQEMSSRDHTSIRSLPQLLHLLPVLILLGIQDLKSYVDFALSMFVPSMSRHRFFRHCDRIISTSNQPRSITGL